MAMAAVKAALVIPRMMASRKISGCPRSQVNPSRSSPPKARRTGRACGGSATSQISAASAAKVTASSPKGRAMPSAMSAPASGGPRNWFITCSALRIWPLARSISSSATTEGRMVCAALSRKTSAAPSRKARMASAKIAPYPAVAGGGQRGQGKDQRHDAKRQDQTREIRPDHQQPPVGPVGPDAGRQREQEPRQPPGHGDERNQERIAGQKRREPGEGQRRNPVTRIRHGAGREDQPEVPVAAKKRPGHCPSAPAIAQGSSWRPAAWPRR